MFWVEFCRSEVSSVPWGVFDLGEEDMYISYMSPVLYVLGHLVLVRN